MPPQLVVCHCDPERPAYAVCDWCSVVASYYLDADTRDHADRAYDAAGDHMAGRGADWSDRQADVAADLAGAADVEWAE